MGWKNWPYWLKGGLIGVGIGIILAVIGIIAVIERPLAGEFLYFVQLIGIFGLGSFLQTDCVGEACFGNVFIALILMPIGYLIKGLLVGAITGWVVGKIKAKK